MLEVGAFTPSKFVYVCVCVLVVGAGGGGGGRLDGEWSF